MIPILETDILWCVKTGKHKITTYWSNGEVTVRFQIKSPPILVMPLEYL